MIQAKAKALLLLAATVWIFSSCTGALQQCESGPAAKMTSTGSTSHVAPVPPSALGNYLDRQERELYAVLSQKEYASVQREADALLVTFRSDEFFDLNSTLLKRGASAEIVQLAELLQHYPETHVKICGHTDSSGSERYNLDLSQRRVLVVRRLLMESGIKEERISAEGYGESMPITSNATDLGRRMNRRITFILTPKSP